MQMGKVAKKITFLPPGAHARESAPFRVVFPSCSVRQKTASCPLNLSVIYG